MKIAIRQVITFIVTSSGMLWAASHSPLPAAEAVIPLWGEVAPGSEEYQGEEVYQPRNGDNGWVTGVSEPTMTMHLPPVERRSGTGVLICPGGGYGCIAIDHEGHAVGKWLSERGVLAAVLKYRHGGGQHQHPVPLSDAQRALRIMRSQAQAWKLQSTQIGVLGFSAGGHLASTAGTHFDLGDADAADPVERASCQANFMVLIYPVISMQTGVAHEGSKKNLLGKKPAPELVDLFSNELQVTADTGPTFLAHASDDKGVPVENSLLFYQSLRKHHVPAEMHIYEIGGHGFGMFRGDRPADRWPELLEGWLRSREWIP